MINISGGKICLTEIYGSYTVVLSPTGVERDALPNGSVGVKVDDQTFVKLGDTYYLSAQVNGKSRDEIVQVAGAE